MRITPIIYILRKIVSDCELQQNEKNLVRFNENNQTNVHQRFDIICCHLQGLNILELYIPSVK